MKMLAVGVVFSFLASSSLVVVSAAQERQTAVPQERAGELYTTNCQICHGPSGKGSPLTKGSAFVGRAWKHGSRQADVVKTIANGAPGTMMLPFKDKLTADEIAALASLVRSFDKRLKPGTGK